MFSVILVQEEGKRKRLFKKRKSKIEAVQTAVRGGAPFRIIKMSPARAGFDWQKAASLCGEQSVILQKGLEPPAGIKLNLFKSDTLPLLIALNTAVERLSRDEKAKTRKLLICDKDAVMPDYIERAVFSAAKIKVLTECPEKYYSASMRLLEHYGAAITVCDSVHGNEKFDACVAPSEKKNCKENFTAEQIEADGSRLAIPDEFLRLCPKGVDPFEFCCALFECSGVRTIGELHLIFE